MECNVDMMDRRTWVNARILMKDAVGSHVARGRVVAADPADAVGNESLGDLHLGVLVLHVIDRAAGLEEFSLVRFPLEFIQFENIMEPVSSKSRTSTTTGKRSYTYIKRKKKEARTGSISDEQSPSANRNANQVAAMDCCKNRCCQYANREAIKAARESFYNMDWSGRRETVFSALRQSVDSCDSYI